MHWHEELAFRIARKSGPLRVMNTLLDANRAITQDLPTGYLKRPHWLEAGQALMKAADSGERADIAVATELLVQAVDHEGWMHKNVVTGAYRLKDCLRMLDRQLRECIAAPTAPERKPTLKLIIGANDKAAPSGAVSVELTAQPAGQPVGRARQRRTG